MEKEYKVTITNLKLCKFLVYVVHVLLYTRSIQKLPSHVI